MSGACVSEDFVRSFIRSIALIALGLALCPVPARAEAQPRRHPRPVVVARYAPYYSPFYNPYYSSLFWSPYGWWPNWYGPPYAYAPAYDYASSVRIQVVPREAEVYVDGFLVGTVDNFDGFSQRLRIQPGEHVIEIYLKGYRTLQETMLCRPGESYKIKKEMEKVAPGDTAPVRPVPAPHTDPPTAPPDSTAMPPAPGRRDWPGRREARGSEAAGFGTLSLRCQPADATVIVDGEKWETTPGTDRLTIELAAGPHQVEIRKDGRKPFSTTAMIRPGEVTTLNVSLPAER
jgi:hypothetical protein